MTTKAQVLKDIERNIREIDRLQKKHAAMRSKYDRERRQAATTSGGASS